jgi:FkbM family methyltransferase
MELIKVLLNILNHPFNQKRKLKAFIVFFKWQLVSRIWRNFLIHQLTENSKVLVRNGLIGVTGNIYTGLLEFEDMMFALHLLEKDDVFIDVGANVGVYSIMLSAEKQANSFAFEPIPETFKILETNVKINNLENKIKIFNIGLGKERNKIKFFSNLDVSNHVISNQEVTGENVITLDISPLDDLSISEPVCMKIDVEGFEMEVLKGANSLLKSKSLNAIIIELNGSGLKYGVKDIDIHNYLLNYGFVPISYNPFKREIKDLDIYGNKNTIYIRDKFIVNSRLIRSSKININGQRI